MAIDYLFAVYDAHDKSSHVVFTLSIEARHLSSFATQQDAAIFTTTVRDAFDDRRDYFRRQSACGYIVEKEKRPRSLNQNVVRAVVHQIASDGVMDAGGKSDLQLGADAIGRCDQNRLAHPGERAIEHSAKAANLRQSALVKGGAGEFLDFFGGPVGGVYVHARVAIGCRFRHRSA